MIFSGPLAYELQFAVKLRYLKGHRHPLDGLLDRRAGMREQIMDGLLHMNIDSDIRQYQDGLKAAFKHSETTLAPSPADIVPVMTIICGFSSGLQSLRM